MARDARIYVAGHRGMVGRALVRALKTRGHANLLLRSRAEVDLRDGGAVRRFFEESRPEYVFLAAAKVGGILANSEQPAAFLHDNLAIALNVIEAARAAGVTKLVNLGSSCIYPRLAPQPMREDALLTGPLEPTNEAYAIAKIAAIKLCDGYRKQYGCNFISLMPTNLYGPYDNFDLHTSHVLPALIRKCDDARERGDRAVNIWGSGTPRREFLHVDDLAEACLFAMERWDDPGFLNVGTGEDITIADAARVVAEVVGFRGEFEFDRSKPDGTPRKLLDVSRLNALGWRARIGFRDGIADAYAWYRDNVKGGVHAEAH
jgi:GDP-L-fucose synthase